MRDEQEGDADIPLDRLELHLHLLAELEVEGAEGLVEEEHAGPVDEGAGQRDALALPTGELPRPAGAEVRQPHLLQRLHGAGTALLAADLLDAQAVLDVLEDAHVREQRVVLEHRVDVAVVGLGRGHVPPAELDAPRRRGLEAGDHPQDRRLAGARGAQH